MKFKACQHLPLTLFLVSFKFTLSLYQVLLNSDPCDSFVVFPCMFNCVMHEFISFLCFEFLFVILLLWFLCFGPNRLEGLALLGLLHMG